MVQGEIHGPKSFLENLIFLNVVFQIFFVFFKKTQLLIQSENFNFVDICN